MADPFQTGESTTNYAISRWPLELLIASHILPWSTHLACRAILGPVLRAGLGTSKLRRSATIKQPRIELLSPLSISQFAKQASRLRQQFRGEPVTTCRGAFSQSWRATYHVALGKRSQSTLNHFPASAVNHQPVDPCPRRGDGLQRVATFPP